MEFGIIVLYKKKKTTKFRKDTVGGGKDCNRCKLVSFQALYNETGWETLEVCRKKQKLTLFL